MALTYFHEKLAASIFILLVAVILLVCGNACTGDGNKLDTCPDGEYCDGDQCHNCSLCSLELLLGGSALTKCLCDSETSAKICPARPGSEQLIEDPSQLSFLNWTGFENIDFTYLKESYDRSAVDCTLPTTTKEPTTAPSSQAMTSGEMIASETSTAGGRTTTEELPTSGKDPGFVLGILVGVGIMVCLIIVVALIVCCVKKKQKKNPDNNQYNLVPGNPNPAQTGGVSTGGTVTVNERIDDGNTGDAENDAAGTEGVQSDGKETQDAETTC